MKKVILNFAWAFAALLFCLSCEDDIGIDYKSCWANERDDRFYFIEEFGEGTLCVYQDHQLLDKEFYNYSLKGIQFFYFPVLAVIGTTRKAIPLNWRGIDSRYMALKV